MPGEWLPCREGVTLTSLDTVKIIHVEALQSWERNPRLHPDDNVARIAASIRRFGLVRLPVLATWPGQDAGVVIAGNGVSAALRLLRTGQPDNPPAGITPDWGVPVRPMWFPSQQEAEAYGLADNWIAQDSHDDPALVEVILTEFEAMGVDTDTICVPPEYLLGGDEPGEEPATDEDDAPSEDDTLPDSKLGEVYELGPHRLVCGDALSQPRLTYDCIVLTHHGTFRH